MSRDELGQWLRNNGWTIDAWGHYHKGKYRFKMQASSCRFEKEAIVPAGPYTLRKKLWVRLRSNYYSQLSIIDGKLAGLKLEGC